ncbi:AraC family transcriptional regulator [Nocardia cyriacigeorgica]|uniref:AraC family transcriptional regulator n=1 Tax=Nocardia cyriacigeorgica TaxID=135487 RepID=A0A6P1D455_9NOCA|nr:AraC family transcriptional regulator [Nocardia cyriacigeorgica]NEW42215.1 AraC family transcriptional regulator [Nocardia cyriacigeorgica]NEW44224.1 AraC family transcriptional regulator [Nocardia cyriacigeorgica]NEW56954.1 AraC family transcriptional regulator [Nocardia cyriacigeorgica]
MLMSRSAVLNDYVEVAESVGLNPHSLMRVAGIDLGALTTTTTWIPAQSVDHLLEISAAQSCCPDFGVRMSVSRGLSNLGPVGLIAREEPDVRSALGIVLRHISLHNQAIDLSLTESGGLTTLYAQSAPGITLGRQSIELVVASVFRILADLLPTDWQPVAICLAHEAPPDIDTHHRMLGQTVTFGQGIDGIITASSDLETPNPLSNPLLRPFTQEYLGLLAPATGTTLPLQVRDLIATLLPTENCSATRIAHSLGTDRRTLHRHLANAGESYSSILDAVRTEHARRAIDQGTRSLTEIAAELGFSELSAFSRWFRQRFGVSPRAWAKRTTSDDPR